MKNARNQNKLYFPEILATNIYCEKYRENSLRRIGDFHAYWWTQRRIWKINKHPGKYFKYKIGTFQESFLWGLFSVSGLLRWPEWWEKYPTSGRGSPEERSPVVSRFSEWWFLDVHGTATEQVRTCGFRETRQALTMHPRYITLFC